MDPQTASESLKALNQIEDRIFITGLFIYVWFLIWLFRGMK